MARRSLATEFIELSPGVYIRRRGDAVHIVTTGDQQPPVTARNTDGVATKDNWVTDEEVALATFDAVAAVVSPDWRGILVNVGTDEEPFLLSQLQAERFQGHVAREVAEARSAPAPRVETAIPVAAVR